MNSWLFLPPVTFILIFAFTWALSLASSKLSFSGGKQPPGRIKPYACGEDISRHRLQPNYAQFFPFAFFFTIMHVVALILATIPPKAVDVMDIAVLYLIAAISGLFILFRR